MQAIQRVDDSALIEKDKEPDKDRLRLKTQQECKKKRKQTSRDMKGNGLVKGERDKSTDQKRERMTAKEGGHRWRSDRDIDSREFQVDKA